VVLRQQGAEPARRRAHYREGPTGEDIADVSPRARGPVDRVLEHAGNAVVVFGCRQDHAIRRGNRFLERNDSRRRPMFGFLVGIVERNAVERPDL
jgi:hypothetical protein